MTPGYRQVWWSAWMLLSCNSSPEAGFAVYQANGATGFIVDSDTTSRDLNSKLDLGWTPDRESLARFEARFQALEPEMTVTHKRQYLGIMEGKQKTIRVIFYCSEIESNLDWQKRIGLVLDAEPCFRRATFRVDTGEIDRWWL